MTSYWNVHQGFLIMLFCVMMGYMFAFSGGYMIDWFLVKAYENEHFQDPLGTAWEGKSEPFVHFWINLYYIIVCIFPLIGIGVFLMTILRKQQYDEEYWRYDQ